MFCKIFEFLRLYQNKEYIRDILFCALALHHGNKEEDDHNQPVQLFRGYTLFPLSPDP